MLPWNPPAPLSSWHSKWIVETDCFYRTRHNIETQLVLDVGQVIVPRRESSVQRVLDAHARKGLFTVPILKFWEALQLTKIPAENSRSSTWLFNLYCL